MHTQSVSTGSFLPKSRRTVIQTTIGILLSLGLGWWLWSSSTAAPQDRVAAATSGPVAAPVAAVEPAAESAAIPQRQLIPEPRVARSFEDYLEELVRIGLQTGAAMEGKDEDAAKASDLRARGVFEQMLAEVDNVHVQAVRRISELPEPRATTADQLRQRVCALTIAHGLQLRLDQVTAGQPREQLDALVTGILTVLPVNPTTAQELGLRMLVDKPYLGAAHEPTVLELVDMAGAGKFDGTLATRLLTTLWHNLGRSGERSADSISRLALLWMHDANPAQRLAALEMLLGDPRYRDMVIDIVQKSGDQQLQHGLALAAAERLPPEVALQVLEQCGLRPAELMGPYLSLGNRHPRLLRELYERRLADNSEPAQRAELVRAAGFARSQECLDLAQFALQSDPDRDVRISAAFVVTARAGEASGEKAIADLLDDPDNHTARRLGTIACALRNLAHQGQINAVDRLGQRLRQMPQLGAGDRASLDALLAETLPGGSPSNGSSNGR